MNNRLEQYLNGASEPEGPAYWQVAGRFEWYIVDEATAAGIMHATGRRWPPRWLYFEDIFGCRVALRSRDVLSVSESSVESREGARKFRKALSDEEPDDRPWEGC